MTVTSFSLFLVVMLATGASFFPGDDFEEVSYEPSSDIFECVDMTDLRLAASGVFSEDATEAIALLLAGDCLNGGPGATSCDHSIELPSIFGSGGGSIDCGVECGDGYYACCNATCTCESV